MQKKYFMLKTIIITAIIVLVSTLLIGLNVLAASSPTCTPPPSAKGTTDIQHYCVPDCASNTGSSQTNTGCVNVNVAQCNGSNCDLIKAYVNPAINIASGLVGILVVIGLLSGAVQYSASGGNPQAATKAKSRMSNAVIALIAFAFLYALLQWLIPGGIFNGG